MEEIETRMGMKGRKMMLCKTYVKQYHKTPKNLLQCTWRRGVSIPCSSGH